MEENIKQGGGMAKDIAFSRAIKAGKRIYYIDVKRSRNDEMFMSITESKKVVTGEDSQVNFEKHKIFVYKEDLDRLKDGISDAISFIEENQGKAEQRREDGACGIKNDMEP